MSAETKNKIATKKDYMDAYKTSNEQFAIMAQEIIRLRQINEVLFKGIKYAIKANKNKHVDSILLTTLKQASESNDTLKKIKVVNSENICPICKSEIQCRESEMPLSFPESMRKYPNIFYGCKCHEGSSKDKESAKRYYIEGMRSRATANKTLNKIKVANSETK